jgi:hypothetical protein
MDEVYPNRTVDARPKGTFLKRNNRGNIGPNTPAVIHIVHIRIDTGRLHNPGRNVDTPILFFIQLFSSNTFYFSMARRRACGWIFLLHA